MNPLEAALDRITQAVGEAGFGFALVGGLAVSARAEPRLTRDADLAVAVDDDAAAERLVHRLSQVDYSPGLLVEQECTGRLSTVRLAHPGDGGLVVDLLFASNGIEHEIVAAAEVLEITPGLSLPVASVPHLLVMKLLARDDRQRPMDADDLRALRTVVTDAEWDQAEQAALLVEQRGFHRGRDLVGSLRELRLHGPYGR